MLKSNKRPKNINEYIKTFPKNVAKMLRTIRDIVNEISPKAVEVISYGMPVFKLNGRILLYFAAHTNHIGMYPYPSAVAVFGKELSKYKTGRSTIQFPFDKPLPETLIRKIVKFRCNILR